MEQEEILKNAFHLLRRFHEIGQEQIDTFRNLHPSAIRQIKKGGRFWGEYNGEFLPIDDVVRRVSVEENVFIAETIIGFWNYFYLNMKYIEIPARQGIDRTLIELCYQKFIPFTVLSPAERKRVILITNICDIGMILAAPSNKDLHKIPKYTEDYNFWVSQLSQNVEQNKYKKLQADGYPSHAYSEAKYKLWPSFFKSFVDNKDLLIFPWVGESVLSIDKARNSILKMYLHLHDFVHGSHLSAIPAIDNIETKKHLFGSIVVSTQVGIQMLHSINTAYLGDNKLNLEELIQQSSNLVPRVADRFSHL